MHWPEGLIGLYRSANLLREYLVRLNQIVETIRRGGEVPVRHRRILVGADSEIELERTILRLQQIPEAKRITYPGQSARAAVVAEWLEESQVDDFTVNEIGTDLAAFVALSSGRQVAFANEFAMKYEPADWTGFLPTDILYDSELYAPVRTDFAERFDLFLRAVLLLSGEQSTAFVNATRMRAAACNLISSDISSAYGLLVGALETLSRQFGPVLTEWSNWDQSESWDQFMLGPLGLSGPQATGLRGKLLENKQIRLKYTFIEYVLGSITERLHSRTYAQYSNAISVAIEGVSALPGNYGEPVEIEFLVPKDPAILRRRLGKSYDARSSVFHDSVRLSTQIVTASPWAERQPLSFAGLRLILDDLLETAARSVDTDSAPFPDIQLVHKPDNV
jgi:hypothetical protein